MKRLKHALRILTSRVGATLFDRPSAPPRAALFDRRLHLCRRTQELAVGEVSPRYLLNTKTPDAIFRHVPSAKLIAVLRNPADRAYSAYMMRVRDGWETASFAEALRLEAQRARDNWSWGHYAYASSYCARLKPYFDRFPRDQIKIYIFEEFVRNLRQSMQDMFRFLGVAPNFVPDFGERRNESGVIRNRLVRMLWQKSRTIRGWIRP
ncbi:MAG: sulfotransferase, partial [Rhodospirillales bacterium]|nr:sulfotransferase [Rhodospirillales bacterium]